MAKDIEVNSYLIRLRKYSLCLLLESKLIQNVGHNYMKQTDIQVSLTEFVNFINSSGMKKMTIVANAKAKHKEQAGSPYDYWKDFKDKVKRLLKRQGTRDDLYKVVEEVRDEMRENYNKMIAGYLKFWKPTRMAWLTPAKKMIRIGGVKMMLNPEIGIRWQDKDYMIMTFRNKIAHGDNSIPVKDEHITEFSSLVTDLMIEVYAIIEDGYDSRNYQI